MKLVFFWPWKTYTEHFDSVVVPLGLSRPTSVVTEEDQRESAGALVDEETPAEKKSLEQGSDSDIATIDSLRGEIDADRLASNSAYDRKAKVINKAMVDIGMGKYQWLLFCLCGMGWVADNLWLQTVAVSLPLISAEFGISESQVRFTTLATYLGLTVGALFWGISADTIGRKPAFNATLLLAGTFGLATGGAQSWIAVCGLYAAMGFGAGGNLPVDGSLLLEFLPSTSSHVLTLLSIFWPFGQLYSSLIAWAFMTRYAKNKGWRYFNYTMGATTLLMFFCQFALFHLFESPKYLLSKGRQKEAVMVVRGIAYFNGTKTWLSEEILNEIGGTTEVVTEEKSSNLEIIKRSVGKFSTQKVKPLFANMKLGINTALLWSIWTAIGLAYPLFNAFIVQYLSQADPGAPPTPNSIVYRNYAIQSIVGYPSSVIVAYTVGWKYCGRKGTMAVTLLLTGIFLFCFTISPASNYILAMTCMIAFFQNAAYGVLYAYSPETSPTPNRSTGTGISSGLNRIAGICAPLIAIYGSSASPKVPIYIAGAMFLYASVAAFCLPVETNRKESI